MIALPIVIKEVNSRTLLKQFIYLPQKLYSTYQNWVPPVYDDEWKLHNPKHNKSLESCDVIKALAFKDEKLCGRIMGIIHNGYNKQHNEKTARFYQLDCIDDQETAHALIHFAEHWAKSKGMNTIIGPFGFSDKDPQGAQIEGFEYLPVIVTPTNPPYIPALIEAEGYIKHEDCVSYKLPVPQTLPEVYENIYKRLAGNRKLRLVEFTTKKQMKPYILPVLRLVNETYAPLFGFVPMTEQEMKNFAAQYMLVLDPTLVKIVETTEKEIVAFIVAMADMSRGLQKAKGKILPFGFLHMLKDARKTKQLNLMLGAIKPRYRGAGLNVLLAKALTQTAMQRGFALIDSHLILENNTRMCAELANLGGTVYKRYRIYKKQL
jgi:hypothetical protein